jgi:hypothetical protein
MNKKLIDENYYKCLLDSPELRLNTEHFIENLMYRTFGTFFDLYQIYIDGTIPKFHKYPGVRHSEDSKKLVYKGFYKDLIKNENPWVHTQSSDSSKDTIIIGDDFCAVTSGSSLYSNGILIYCKDDSVAERLSKYLYIYQEKKETSFNYITAYQGGFGHNSFELPKNLDVPLDNYTEDFPWEQIKNFCEADKPGIFLLYGTPGCGKSMLIRKLILECDTTFFVLDASILNNITSASFIDYLTDECRNCVLILEDCEGLLKDREHSFNPFMSTILNLTDGLLGDGMKLKFICTFNTSITQIDPAVLRKGRLVGKYEFKKLSKDKANSVCKRLNLPLINKEATLAEIYNQDENDFSRKETKKIGF